MQLSVVQIELHINQSFMEIISFRYNDITETNAQRLKELLDIVWGNNEREVIHPQEFNVMSFCASDGTKWIGYAGVITWNIQTGGQAFKMGALSSVCTHPSCRRMGIGSRIVREATVWMQNSHFFDVGLFTCSLENIPFYNSIGLWQSCPNLVLKESNRKGAYASDECGLHVFKRLISEKACLYASCFDNTIITLNLPEGHFI